MENYSSLLEEYQCEGLLRFTPFVMLLRVACAIPLLVVMSPYPVVQSIGFTVYNALVSMWFLVLRPGKGKLKNIFVCIREFLILTINGLYTMLSFEAGEIELYSKVIVAAMMAIYALEMASGLIGTIMAIAEWIGSLCNNSEKVSPEQENQDVKEKEIDAQSDRLSIVSARTQDSKMHSPGLHYKPYGIGESIMSRRGSIEHSERECIIKVMGKEKRLTTVIPTSKKQYFN
eukprot:TRINITY_DN2275_c2_g1_i1.p8 TRINITY_DN2275_c2_g1~~TRINITY_DN2275_c2_g1_i1.p8  ORF type:complete len:231 (+),score=13.94 TRINITY_DN2275_c2_g1_i1:3696-4388(+)